MFALFCFSVILGKIMKVTLGQKGNRSRKQQVLIEECDLDNLEKTMALIIWPALVYFKENTDGVIQIENQHLPTDLQYSYPRNVKDFKPNHEKMLTKQYEYAMNEMIWGFKQIAQDQPDAPNEHSNEHQQYLDRIQKACEMYGFYFRGFWN